MTVHFDVEDVAEALLFGVGVYFLTVGVLELLQGPEPRSTFTDERVLRRLEDGGTIQVPRWHGHELEIRGEVVTDVSVPVEEA